MTIKRRYMYLLIVIFIFVVAGPVALGVPVTGSSGDIELNWLDSRDEFGGYGDFRRQAFPATRSVRFNGRLEAKPFDCGLRISD